MQNLYERVLSCTTLPSLPGVAVKVLELTRDRNVSVSAIAQTVQSDPALAAKVLRTVNSSYYRLSKPCPSISRAMALLGLNTVKAVVLSFSLVDFTRKLKGDARLDLSAFWRRGVYSAAAARTIATKTRACDPDEAFVAALLADIGVLASFMALGDEYAPVLAIVGDDHDRLAALEREKLGFDHAQAGSVLGKQWNLPPDIVAAVAHSHNTPSTCTEPLSRVVQTAGHLAATMTLHDPKPSAARLTARAREWFALTENDVRELVRSTAADATELAKLLDVRVGSAPDPVEILSAAQEQLSAAQMELERSASIDALTGLLNRAQFDRQLREDWDRAAAGGAGNEPGSGLAVLFTDVDKFKSINDTLGHQAGDAVLAEVARRVNAGAHEVHARAFRYGGEEFVVLAPGLDRAGAAALAESLRASIEQEPVALPPPATGPRAVTVSLGVAFASDHGSPAALLKAADEALYAAKRAGRNRVILAHARSRDDAKGATPAAPTPAGANAISVLIVEDDPLAAKLLKIVLGKRPEWNATFVHSAEEALAWAATNRNVRLVLTDVNLPGISGLELIVRLRADLGLSGVPAVVLTGSADQRMAADAARAGAADLLNKTEFCTDFEGCMERLRAALARAGRAKAA